jgi:hypothetical protein
MLSMTGRVGESKALAERRTKEKEGASQKMDVFADRRAFTIAFLACFLNNPAFSQSISSASVSLWQKLPSLSAKSADSRK